MDKVEARLKREELKTQRHIAELNALRDVTKTVLGNPIVELLGGCAIGNLLCSGGIIADWQRDAIGLAATTIIGVQQLAPFLPYIQDAAKGFIPMGSGKGILGLLPAPAS